MPTEDAVVEQPSQTPEAPQPAPAAPPAQPAETPPAAQPDKPAKPDTGNAGLLAAIEEGLAKKKAAKEQAVPPTGKEQPPVDPKLAKPEAQQKPEQKPEKVAQKRKSDEFELTDDEKRVLSIKAQTRYHDVLGFAKKQEAVAEKFKAENQALSQARDAIMSVLEETHTKAEHLSELLRYNSMVQTGNLEGALEMIEAQRAELLRLLGREAPGVDLLSEYPDLSQRAQNMELSRQDALEIANARRRQQMIQQHTQQQSTVQQQATQRQQEQTNALQSIDSWVSEMAKSDLDYKAKEAKVLPKLQGIIKTYPPNLWLPALKDLYSAIEVVKPESQPGPTPLRPGGSAGQPQPGNMLDAISRGLGYNG